MTASDRKGRIPFRYNYKLWANGELHTLVQGEDFSASPRNFRTGLSAWARNNDCTVEAETLDEVTVQIRFHKGRTTGCEHCGVPFDRRPNAAAQKFCEDCVPRGNHRARRLMTYYRLAWPEYEAMYFEQDGLCPICKVWEAEVVDHDHSCCPDWKSCGKCVRGLLCGGCNLNITKWEEEGANLQCAPYSAGIYLIFACNTVRRRLHGPRTDNEPEPWTMDAHKD